MLIGLLASQFPASPLYAAPEPGAPVFPNALAAHLRLSPAQIRAAVNRREHALANEAKLQAELETAQARLQAQVVPSADRHAAEKRVEELGRRLEREQSRAREALRQLLGAAQRKRLDELPQTPGLEALAREAAAAGFLPSSSAEAPAVPPCPAASGTSGKPRQDLCEQRG